MEFNNLELTGLQIPQRTDSNSMSNDMIHWHLTITNKETGAIQSVEYSCGIGHYVNMCSFGSKFEVRCAKRAELWLLGKIKRNEFMNFMRGTAMRWQSLFNKDNVNLKKTPIHKPELKAPKLEDVLYSLTMDSDAIDYSFEEWCDNCGYDTDSIKATKIFAACRDNFTKLKRLDLSLEELQKHFEDY